MWRTLIARRRVFQTVLISLVGVVASGCGCGGCGYEQIEPGEVGIVFSMSNGISQHIQRPQMIFVGPRTKLMHYPTTIKNATYTVNPTEGERRGDNSIKANTLEGATLPVDITVAYYVAPEDAPTAFANYGTAKIVKEVQPDFIRAITIYGVNVVSGKKPIFDLTSKDRSNFGAEVKAVIAPMLKGTGITVQDVYLGEVYPDQNIQSKVTERVAKKNDLDIAKNNLEKARIEAKTILTRAQQQADINKLLAQQSGTAIALKRLDLRRKAIEKWDGQPPTEGDPAVPFTNVNIGQ